MSPAEKFTYELGPGLTCSHMELRRHKSSGLVVWAERERERVRETQAVKQSKRGSTGIRGQGKSQERLDVSQFRGVTVYTCEANPGQGKHVG